MQTVTHRGRATAYQRFDRGGDGPIVLCVHGSGGNRGIWKAQSRLADEFPIVALDLSGHGDSEDVQADPGFGALSAYASDVLAVAEETGATVLIGNSLGGALAMHVALHRKHPFEQFVFAGSGARLAVLEDLLNWLDGGRPNVDDRTLADGSVGDFDRVVEFLHGPNRLFHDPEDDLVDRSKAAMYDCGQAVVRRDFRTCHRFDVRDRIREISVPSLALVGEYDQLTPVWYHEHLAEELPNCRLGIVENAAHLAMLERPDPFNAALSEFLSQSRE